MSNAIRLAEKIHHKTCHYNHIDQCSWGFESWEGNPLPLGYARRHALGQADRMLTVLTAKFNISEDLACEVALDMIDAL